MTTIRTVLLSFILLTTAHAEPKTVHLLTVGNSFANNALAYLPQLAEEAGHTLVVGRANLGGCTLERHWKHVTQFEADPESPDGRPYGSDGKKQSLAQLLASKPWDIVTIQQVSIKSHDPATYRPYAENLHAYITERAPQAKILLHQIWAYRTDDPRFTPVGSSLASDRQTPANLEPHTHQLMYEQVRAANHTIAAELGIGILPSGDAMFAADTDPEFGYKPDTSFDFKTATPPALPDQTHSLHIGWRWTGKPDEPKKLSIDGHHANSAGEYLLGCLWFKTLFAEDPTTLTYTPKNLDPAHAAFLRQVAHRIGSPAPAKP